MLTLLGGGNENGTGNGIGIGNGTGNDSAAAANQQLASALAALTGRVDRLEAQAGHSQSEQSESRVASPGSASIPCVGSFWFYQIASKETKR